MSRYLGIRFEDRYRTRGHEPFRFDHPTVAVPTNGVRQVAAVAERCDHAALGERFRDHFQVQPGEFAFPAGDGPAGTAFFEIDLELAAAIHEDCEGLAAAVEGIYDLPAVEAEVDELAEPGARATTVREAVGAARHDAVHVHRRLRRIQEVCREGFRLDVPLEVG